MAENYLMIMIQSLKKKIQVLDCIIDSMALCHHAPFMCTDFIAEDRENVGIPIPLLNLVYHDCVVIPWIGRKNSRGGWGIPGNDSAYAHAWLNGGPQYLSINADEEAIAEVTATCANAEKLALQPMLKHEFVTADRRTQRTTFADGTTVTKAKAGDVVTVNTKPLGGYAASKITVTAPTARPHGTAT